MYGIIFQGKEADGNWYDVELVPFIPCLNTEDDFRIKPNTQIAELEKQIEKMKCCGNCKYYQGYKCNVTNGNPFIKHDCIKHNKWELAE